MELTGVPEFDELFILKLAVSVSVIGPHEVLDLILVEGQIPEGLSSLIDRDDTIAVLVKFSKHCTQLITPDEQRDTPINSPLSEPKRWSPGRTQVQEYFSPIIFSWIFCCT